MKPHSPSKRRSLALAILLPVVFAVPALLAQPPSSFTATIVQPTTVFYVKADHDGTNVTGYRLYDNSVKIMEDTKANVWSAGVVTFTLSSGLGSTGDHVLAVAAYNGDGEARSTSTVTVTVRP